MTPDVREKAVEAMQRAQWQAERSGKNQYNAMEAALDAALPIIREAYLRECIAIAEDVALQQGADYGAANTGGADTVLFRIRSRLPAPPTNGGGDDAP